MDFDPSSIQAFLDKFSLLGIPAVPLVIALVALTKLLGLPGRFAPYAAMVWGVLVSAAIYLIDWNPTLQGIIQAVLLALMLGLAAVGLHAGYKAAILHFQTVPPGTVIQTPAGVTDTTPTNTFTEGKRGPKKPGEV
jgi:hypothetical protein